MRLPALAFSSSLPFSRNADVKHQTQKLMDMAAEAAGLCAKEPRSTFGPQALGGEGQRYPSCPQASTSTAKLFRHDEVHLALARLAADDGRWDDAAREVALELAVQPTSREALALRARIDAARSAGRP